MDLSQLDYASLAALRQLLDTGSVTAAARRAGVTQPSMSRTLSRLRRLFGDPLLVPVGRTMERTRRARALQPRLQEAIEAVERLVEPLAPREPTAEARSVRIACTDYATVVVLQPWLRRLQRAGSPATVRVTPVGVDSIDLLARGDLDLAIAPRVLVEGIEQFVWRKLFDDRLVCVLGAGHPAASGRLGLNTYLALSHVVVSSARPTPSTVDEALHERGRSRRIALSVPSFLQALSVVASSDFVAALPERLVRAAGAAVVTRALPLPVAPLSLSLIWHPRRTTDARHRWLREGLSG